jgi:lipopolysaccharide export system permease protein
MPVLWRYLATHYLKGFFLTVGAFLAILLTSRLEEIAHFASFGAGFLLVLFFALLQIPYILPIAIAVACLIASAWLMQTLSEHHELVAMRSAGFSLKEIAAPVIITSLFLSVLNFYIVSEVATFSHLQTNLLKNEMRSINPLLLLHNKNLMRAKGIYYDVLGPSKMGQLASSVILAMPSSRGESLALLLANRLEIQGDIFRGDNISYITATSAPQRSSYAHLMLENIGSTSSAIYNFADIIQKKMTQFHEDHLSLSLLRLRLAFLNPENPPEKKSIRLIYSEFARRLSASLAPFSFTLMGLAFGISITRLKSRILWIWPISLAALYLFCFFAAKSLADQTVLAYALFLIPHVLIAIVCIWRMKRISQGIGS